MSGFLRKFGVVVLIAGLGCAAEDIPEDRPQLVPVSGTVLFNGQPVEDAHVTFHSEEESIAAFGRTDAQGRFTLRSFAPGDGAVPGNHTVTVSKLEAAATGTVTSPEDDLTQPDEVPEPESLLPEQYGNPAESDLTATVTAEGDNDFTFELQD